MGYYINYNSSFLRHRLVSDILWQSVTVLKIYISPKFISQVSHSSMYIGFVILKISTLGAPLTYSVHCAWIMGLTNLAYEPCNSPFSPSNIVFLFYISSVTICLWTHCLSFVLFHTCFISYSKLTACRRRVYSDHPFWLENSTIAMVKLSNCENV